MAKVAKNQTLFVKSKPHSITLSKKKVVFPITEGEVRDASTEDAKYLSPVVLDDSVECHVFLGTTDSKNKFSSGTSKFTLCHMTIPKEFEFVPHAISNGKLAIATAKATSLAQDNLNTLVLLNIDSSVIGHFCKNSTGKRFDHGSACCSCTVRPLDTDDIILFQYEGELSFLSTKTEKYWERTLTSNGSYTYQEKEIEIISISKKKGKYYLIPLILPDRSIIYNAILIEDFSSTPPKVIFTEEEIRDKLEIWLSKLNTQKGYCKIGLDTPFYPIWNDELDVFIVTNMFIFENTTTKHYV